LRSGSRESKSAALLPFIPLIFEDFKKKNNLIFPRKDIKYFLDLQIFTYLYNVDLCIISPLFFSLHDDFKFQTVNLSSIDNGDRSGDKRSNGCAYLYLDF